MNEKPNVETRKSICSVQLIKLNIFEVRSTVLVVSGVGGHSEDYEDATCSGLWV